MVFESAVPWLLDVTLKKTNFEKGFTFRADIPGLQGQKGILPL